MVVRVRAYAEKSSLLLISPRGAPRPSRRPVLGDRPAAPLTGAALSDKPERAYEVAGLKRSGRQLTPFGQGGRTVLSEDVAAVEVAVEVEVVVD